MLLEILLKHGIGVNHHGPEFPKTELAAILANPRVNKEHRSGCFEYNSQRNQQGEGKSQDQKRGREDDIEDPLDLLRAAVEQTAARCRSATPRRRRAVYDPRLEFGWSGFHATSFSAFVRSCLVP